MRTSGWRRSGGGETQAHSKQDDRDTSNTPGRNRDSRSGVTLPQRPVLPAACSLHCVIAVSSGAARQRGGARQRSPPRTARARCRGGATKIHTRQRPLPSPHGKKRKATGITPPLATEATCCGSGRGEADRPPGKGDTRTRTHTGNGARGHGQTHRRRHGGTTPSSSVDDPPSRTPAPPHCIFQQRAVASRAGRRGDAAPPLPGAGAITEAALSRHLHPRMPSPLPH